MPSDYPYPAAIPTWTLMFKVFTYQDGYATTVGVNYNKYHSLKANIMKVVVSEKDIYDATNHILLSHHPLSFGTCCYEKYPLNDMHLRRIPYSFGFPYLAEISLFGVPHYNLVWHCSCGTRGFCNGAILIPSVTTGFEGDNSTVEKIFGEDGNQVYAALWGAQHRDPGWQYWVIEGGSQDGCQGLIHGFNVGFGFQLFPRGTTPPAATGDSSRYFSGVYWHVVYDSVVGSTVHPPDGTIIFDGGSVVVDAVPDAGKTLILFTVKGIDRLAQNPILIADVHADVHVSALADYSKISEPAASPISIVLACNTCGPQSWSATGLAALGLSINATTGEITGTIPYGTTPGDYPVVITLDNDGRIVTRTIIITVTAPTIFGNAFTPVGRIGTGAIYSLCQLANGAILIGTADATGPKVYKTDIVFTTPTDVTGVIEQVAGKAVTSIVQLASGTVLCTTDHTGGSRGIVFRSTDNGDNWTKVLSAGIGTINAMDIVEHFTNAVYVTTGDAVAKLLKSADDGLTWTNAYYFSDGLNHYGRKIGKIDWTNIQFTATSSYNGSEIIRTTGAIGVGGSMLDVAVNDTVSAGFVKCLDSSFLASINEVVYTGLSDGSAWTTLQTMPRNIGCMVRTPNPYKGIIMASFGTAGINTYRSTDDMVSYTTSVTGLDGTNARALIQLADGRFLLGVDGTTTNLYISAA